MERVAPHHPSPRPPAGLAERPMSWIGPALAVHRSGTRIALDSHADPRGTVTVAQPGRGGLPFVPARAYWLHGLTGAARGGHAHRHLSQVMVALNGALTVELEDARGPSTHRLDDPTSGLLVGPMCWRELRDFAPGTVCLVLADAPYDAADYIHDRAAFRAQLRVFA